MHRNMLVAATLTIALQAKTFAQEAPMTALRPDQTSFLVISKELVETNTTLSSGSFWRRIVWPRT
jgi:hypothetical protein